MIYDERHGWVERGTPGHRASAQVVDVDAEIRAMHRIISRPPYDMDLAARRYAQVWVFGETARHVRGCDVVQGVSRQGATMYAVEGDTLHIVHNVHLPSPAQTISVNVTIGGEG